MNCLKLSVDHSTWKDLKGKKFLNEIMVLTYIGNVYLFEDGPIFNCTTLFLKVNKSFMEFWFNKRTFPNLINLYIQSSMRNSYEYIKNIYLHEDFSKNKNQLKNVRIVNRTDYNLTKQFYSRL
jgi:hypothetical protein